MSGQRGLCRARGRSAGLVRHPSADSWISPAYLPPVCRTSPAHELYTPGWHFGFNIPAFLIVMLLTVVLVRGIRESARTNNIMVLMKIAAILMFIFAGAHFIHPAQLPSLFAEWLVRRARPAAPSSSSPISASTPSPPRRRSANIRSAMCPSASSATLIVCTILYIGVAVVLTGLVPWQTRDGRCGAGGERAQEALHQHRIATACTGSGCSSCWARWWA